MVDIERRVAVRMSLPPEIEASVGGVAVQLVNLSTIGALVEHSERFPPSGSRLNIRWRQLRVDVGIRLVRTLISGRNGPQLVYETGVHFTDVDATNDGVIAAILRAGAPVPPGKPVPPRGDASEEDTWTRTVNFLADNSADDSDEKLLYMRFRRRASGWTKEYVADAVQPYDGFTIPRSSAMEEALVLQRVFESADDTARHKLQLGIDAKVRGKDGGPFPDA